MYRLISGVSAIVFAVVALAAAPPASAETRLFTVRTDQPNVTIVSAVRNGQQLAVAGQNAGATFFRITNPAGAVPCSNRIQFTASNGQVVDAPVDLCANNWDLTLAVGGLGGGTGAGTGGTAGNVGIQPYGTSQRVVITTDDSSLTITDVFLRGQPVPIIARQDPYVQITVLGGPQGVECSRDLGLALSDGRRIARLVDICSTNFFVVINLVGGPRPPMPPPSMRSPAVIQPLPQPPPQQQPPLIGGGDELVTDMQWMFSATGSRASFAYAVPNTDASEFTAVCQTQSSRTTVTLTRSADEVGPGGKVLVRFTAGAFTKAYTATGSVVSELDGLSHPVLQIPTSDPLWPALIKEKVLTIAIGSSPAYGLSLAGSAVKAKQFLAACNPPPLVVAPEPLLPAPGPGPAPGNGATAVGFVCNDGSFLNVAFDNATAVVYEPGAPPVVLLATPSSNGQRYVAGSAQLVGQGEHIFWTRDGGFARTCSPG